MIKRINKQRQKELPEEAAEETAEEAAEEAAATVANGAAIDESAFGTLNNRGAEALFGENIPDEAEDAFFVTVV